MKGRKGRRVTGVWGRKPTASIAGVPVVAGSRLVATASKAGNKKLVIKALTEPAFRRQLMTEPEAALGVSRLSAENKAQIKLVLNTVKIIEGNIRVTSDALLCATIGCSDIDIVTA